jgi:hypothetical protein
VSHDNAPAEMLHSRRLVRAGRGVVFYAVLFSGATLPILSAVGAYLFFLHGVAHAVSVVGGTETQVDGPDSDAYAIAVLVAVSVGTILAAAVAWVVQDVWPPRAHPGWLGAAAAAGGGVVAYVVMMLMLGFDPAALF